MRMGRIGVLVLAMAWGTSGAAVEPPRAGQEAFLSRAVFADGRLWLLTDAGELSSITEGKDQRIDEPLPEPAHDICIHEGEPLVATCKREGCDAATLRRFHRGTWSVDASFKLGKDRIVALACENPAVTVLTTRRLIDFPADGRHEVRLSGSLESAPIATVHATAQSVFVGLNAGEWGGGLRRIDRRTGAVTPIESNTSGGICGGPLNSECDPVNGIATSPRDDQCIAAAIGLVHMATHGRIVEVCGTKVRRLYFKEYGLEGFKRVAASKDEEPFSTTAFFGLARQGNSLWASGIDGTYEIAVDGTARITPLPQFKEIDGVFVSFDSPGVILVLTEVNQRRSVSGAVPLLVPREP
jgi:hypothetical protein